MRKALAVGLMALICAGAIYLASLTGCSSQPTETQSSVMTLDDVHDEYGDELLAQDTAYGMWIEVYRVNTDSSARAIVIYRNTDSCQVSILSADGDLQPATKPMSEYTKCLINGCAVCDQWWDKDKDPVEHAQCVTRVMIQCACWDTLFSWLYGKLAK